MVKKATKSADSNFWAELLSVPYSFQRIEGFLNAKENPYSCDPGSGQSLLHYCLSQKPPAKNRALVIQREHLLKNLLSKEKLINAEDGLGMTPLMLVCKLMLGVEELVMLINAKANPNYVNEKGWTPLICIGLRSVIASNAAEYIDILCKAGAKPDKFYEKNFGWTPLMISTFMNYPSEVNSLLTHGAQKSLVSLGINDYPVENALDIAKRMNYAELIKLLA